MFTGYFDQLSEDAGLLVNSVFQYLAVDWQSQFSDVLNAIQTAEIIRPCPIPSQVFWLESCWRKLRASMICSKVNTRPGGWPPRKPLLASVSRVIDGT